MKNDRFCTDTTNGLYSLFKNLYCTTGSVKDGHCIGCGVNRGLVYEDGDKSRLYCQQDCQKVYHNLFLMGGYKRLRDGKDTNEVDERTFHQFLKVLEVVDESLIVPMIIFAFPNYKTEISDMRKLLKFRRQSHQIRDLVDRLILNGVTKLPTDLGRWLTEKVLYLFPNLVELDLTENENVSSVARLTKLEKLTTTKLLNDTEISQLTNLRVLRIDRNNNSISTSLLNLPFLTELYIEDHESINNDLMGRLTTLQTLEISGYSLLTMESISKLSNLTFFDIYKSDGIDNNSLLALSTQLKVLTCSHCEHITSINLGEMRSLEQLVITDCPLEDIRTISGILRNNYLTKLDISRSPMTTIDFRILLHLTELDISHTTIHSGDLSKASKLKKLYANSAPNIFSSDLAPLANTLTVLHMRKALKPSVSTDSINKLTNLVTLDLESVTNMKGYYLTLSSLRELNLTKCTGILSVGIKYLTNLEKLNLTKNYYVDKITMLTKLKELVLEENRSIKSNQLKTLVNLELINLKNNKIIDGRVLKNLKNLRTIILFNGVKTSDYLLVNEENPTYIESMDSEIDDSSSSSSSSSGDDSDSYNDKDSESSGDSSESNDDF